MCRLMLHQNLCSNKREKHRRKVQKALNPPRKQGGDRNRVQANCTKTEALAHVFHTQWRDHHNAYCRALKLTVDYTKFRKF